MIIDKKLLNKIYNDCPCIEFVQESNKVYVSLEGCVTWEVLKIITYILEHPESYNEFNNAWSKFLKEKFNEPN